MIELINNSMSANMNNKFKRLIKDIFIFSLGSLGSKLILFLLVPLYTNYLTKAEYGTAELVFTIAQLLIPIASVTIWNGLIRYGLMNSQQPESVFKNSILIWLFGSILIIALTPLMGIYSPISEWKWYLCAYSIAYIANQVELNYLKVKGKNKLFSLISVIQTLLLTGLNILLLVYIGIGVQGYLLSNIIANAAAALLVLILGELYKDWIIGKFDRNLAIQLIEYSAPLILNDISWWFIHSSDKIMIEWIISKDELGLYTVASKIPGLINTFVNIFSQAWGVSSIKEIESDNDSGYYSKVFRIYFFLAFGASILFMAIIKPFMAIYVGNEFKEAWQYVPLLLVAASFSAVSAFCGSMFGALKKSVECMWTTIIGAIANIILNYIFISLIGTWGAIVGTVCAFFIIAVIRVYRVDKYIHIDIKFRVLAVDIIVAIIEGVLVSFNWNIVLVSFVSILILIINHFDYLKLAYKRIMKS